MIAFHAALAAQTEKPAPNSRLATKIVATLVGIIFVFICVLQLGLGTLYAGKVYPGVRVADQKLGGLSYAQAETVLMKKIKKYSVPLSIGDKQRILRPGDVGVSYDVSNTAGQAYDQGKENWFVPFGIREARKNLNLKYTHRVDRSVMAKFVQSVVNASGQAPVDAVVDVVKGEPQIIPDKNGFSLNGAELTRALEGNITALNPSPVKLQPAPQPARIQAKDAAAALEKAKQLTALSVTLTHNEKIFTPSLADKNNWLTFLPAVQGVAPGFAPTPDTNKIAAYLAKSVAPGINLAPVVHKVRVENGVSSEQQAGVDGLAVDITTLTQLIATSLARGEPVAAAVPTSPVAFKTEYNRTVTLEYGRYIEINLSSQHLWVYQDKNVIYESPLTSGATGAGYPTIQGLFSIQAKQTNRYLNGRNLGPGYNYNVFVKYWMPFSGDFGMHDASWRNGNFGGQDYYYGGSHGCVNLPEATAAWLYNWADVGTPVWVHG